MKKDVADVAGAFILSCYFQELSPDSLLCPALPGDQLYAEYGRLIRGLTDSHQSCSAYLRVLVEDTFGGN